MQVRHNRICPFPGLARQHAHDILIAVGRLLASLRGHDRIDHQKHSDADPGLTLDQGKCKTQTIVAPLGAIGPVIQHAGFARILFLVSASLEACSTGMGLQQRSIPCRGPWCVMSFEAVAALRKHGFQARRLEDGMPEWKAAGLPVEVTM